MSEFLLSGPPKQAPPAPPGFVPPPGAAAAAAAPRGGTVSLLAGIGVLLLAMGVGVLIGRSGSSSGNTPAPQVINVGGGGTTSSSGEEPVASDWPASKKGWTVELQTLPASTTASAVESAKSAAGGKGATAVGVLKAEEFPSVGGEGFVIYAGEYGKKAEAQKALGSLKKDFPGAKVVEVSGGAEAAGSGNSGSKAAGGAKPKAPSSLSKPAAAGTIGNHGRTSGKKYVEESAKLPNVVSTG